MKPKVSDIIGQSPQIVELRRSLKNIYQNTPLPVLILGETGTGKELVANVLHYSSSRSNQNFIKINCSAITENLFESHLFGHKKGAFTGATEDKKGVFEMADRGTVLLDEIGEMKPEMQPKLLRFLDDQCFMRVGSTREINVDVWIIACTNASLSDLIEKKLFRKDLFYRLEVVKVELPNLWERKEDIPLLINEFLNQEGASRLRFSPETMRRIMAHNWPGNVRELKNLIRYLTKDMKSGLVVPEHLPDKFRVNKENQPQKDCVKTLEEMKRDYIIEIFKKNEKQIRETARLLDIDRNTLRKAIREHEDRR